MWTCIGVYDKQVMIAVRSPTPAVYELVFQSGEYHGGHVAGLCIEQLMDIRDACNAVLGESTGQNPARIAAALRDLGLNRVADYYLMCAEEEIPDGAS